MKKFLFILLLVLGWQEAVGQRQKYPPILPYREDPYSTEEAREFANSGTPLSISWRDSVTLIVRVGILEAMDLVTDPKQTMSLNQALIGVDRWGIEYILSNTSLECVEIEGGFQNSYQDKETVVFYLDKKGFKGMAQVFKVGQFLSIIIDKATCLNVVKVRVMFVSPSAIPVSRTPEGSQLSTSAKADLLLRDTDYDNRSPFVPAQTKTIKNNGWIKPVAIGAGIIIVGFGMYLLVRFLCSQRESAEELEIRTMPGGIGWDIPVFAF